ncbi:MAG: GNAT family N-acetyltransferase [Pseudomonadota bacterium]
MSPEALAALHRRAFASQRAWTAAEFADLLRAEQVSLHSHPNGFALSRTVAGETELLTLAVDPVHQGVGVGRQLIRLWLAKTAHVAPRAFLEVAADNHPARHIYATEGFDAVGRRPAYYARTSAPPVDAIVMQRMAPQLTAPQSADDM